MTKKPAMTRMNNEHALKESEARLNKIQEIAYLGSWELDLVNNNLTWSDEVYRIFGLQPQEFGASYEAFLEAVHPDDRAAVDEAYSSSLRDGRDTYEIEHRIIRKDTGEIRFVHEKCEHMRDESGRIIKSVGMVHDITERKLAENALIESQQSYKLLNSRLQAIFSSIREAIITVDKDLRIIEVNEASKGICGISRSDIGKNLHSCFICNGGCLKAIEETLRSEKAISLDNILCAHKDKSNTKVVEFYSSPLLDTEGRFMGAILVFNDRTRLATLESSLQMRQQLHNIVGQSDCMQNIYSLISDLANIQSTVLITGESGTGKELVAEALHYGGERRDKPFVRVNCSALSESLLESELFGHVKGAFTGADRNRVGRLEMADGGTVFLDEIGDVSRRVQLSLLRVLQEREFERVGESTPIKVDIRVIAATNQDLREKVRKGEFREDLYYRLRVVEITLPPLRGRRGDIPLLTEHFLKMFNNRFNKNIYGVDADVMSIFMNYHWPGNVRELEHALEHACIVCHDPVITVKHLPPELKNFLNSQISPLGKSTPDDYQSLRSVLERAHWNKTKAARLMGINVRTLYRRMSKYKDLLEHEGPVEN
ncbi:MAG: sigma 54-interacting transcriptional regulator [Nitrospirae bacterium]|nr:sigma 54-interacting transcriptional regulator [Nitrospirota bacterium]